MCSNWIDLLAYVMSRKQTVPPTDLSQVLDFSKYAEALKERTSRVDGVSLAHGASVDAPVFVIDGHPGIYPELIRTTLCQTDDQFKKICKQGFRLLPCPLHLLLAYLKNQNSLHGLVYIQDGWCLGWCCVISFGCNSAILNLVNAGFYFIPQALSVEEQFYWIRESLTSFPQPPNRTNHNTMYGPISDLWSHAQERHVLVEDNVNDLENLLAQPEIRGPRADSKIDENCDKYLTAACTSEVTATETPRAQGLNHQENAHTSLHYSDIPPSSFKDNASQARVVHEKPEEGCTKWRFVADAQARSSLTPTSSTKLITAKSLLQKLRWATIGQQFDWGKV